MPTSRPSPQNNSFKFSSHLYYNSNVLVDLSCLSSVAKTGRLACLPWSVHVNGMQLQPGPKQSLCSCSSLLEVVRWTSAWLIVQHDKKMQPGNAKKFSTMDACFFWGWRLLDGRQRFWTCYGNCLISIRKYSTG